MIRYALVCDRKHEFEVWFNNSADYDKQAKRGLVTCPVCDSTKVDKAIMAPAISTSQQAQGSPRPAADVPRRRRRPMPRSRCCRRRKRNSAPS